MSDFADAEPAQGMVQATMENRHRQCDASLYLGGKEPTTIKALSEALGRETIDTYNTGESRGRETSHSLNYQKLGKSLLSVDELEVLDGGKCILQLRGDAPVSVEQV